MNPQSHVDAENVDGWNAHTPLPPHVNFDFPYKDAAPLSSQLWMKITPAKVIMQIVYSEDEVSEELIDYKKKLESYGGKCGIKDISH